MELLRCKARLAVLWVIKAMGFSSFLLLYLLESGSINELMSGKFMGGQLTSGMVVVFGLYWWIPWVMAWLSFTLKGAANRWLNFIVSVIFGIILLTGTIMNASNCSPAMLIDYIIGVVVFALIAWYAWRLPKEEV